jgi:ABC-type Fe3+-hydroxamate transport system substrate-binding protein
MKTACTLVLALLASLQVSLASAQVYQWKDSTGRTVISDSPPPTTKSSRTVSAAPATDSAAVAVGSAPKTAAEKDLDFKKRQQEAKQKADKEAKEQQAAADRRENCERAKHYLASLESGERIAVRDDSGERRMMEDAQRQQEAERARRILAESCK